RKGEAPPPAAGIGGGTGGQADGPVNLNTATLEQLDALPGVGPATAQAILDYRKQHGRFHAVDDLLQVGGIGPSKLEKLRQRVKV
ncbi:MAG: ComEA family DNA-binding protein, partial [Actinobacteria bacterium]|nr:ComEA family DNA-binding protein [Actinomycetota bacterium]